MSDKKRISPETCEPNKRIATSDLPWSSISRIFKRYNSNKNLRLFRYRDCKIFSARRRWIEVLFMLFNRLDKQYPGLADPLIDVVFCQFIFPGLLDFALQLQIERSDILMALTRMREVANNPINYYLPGRIPPIIRLSRDEVDVLYSDLLDGQPTAEKRIMSSATKLLCDMSIDAIVILKEE